jgi:hypothetical protein
VGARKPDGSAAKTERVTFTRPAAERIAKVVRRIESGDRDSTGPKYLARDGGGGSSGKTFRICTYTGAWSINTSNTVTFKNQTTTPNTVSAVNLFLDLPNNGQRNCAIAKDGTAWHLIQWQWDAATALSSATLGSSLEFGRINVPSLGTASTVSISVTTCSTATAS